MSMFRTTFELQRESSCQMLVGRICCVLCTSVTICLECQSSFAAEQLAECPMFHYFPLNMFTRCSNHGAAGRADLCSKRRQSYDLPGSRPNRSADRQMLRSPAVSPAVTWGFENLLKAGNSAGAECLSICCPKAGF